MVKKIAEKEVKNTPKKRHSVKRKFSVYKDKIFKLYVTWLSLPPIFTEKGEQGINALQIKDPTIRELALLKTQGDFAKKFKVDQGTLSSWNRKIEDDDMLFAQTVKWVDKLLGNVVAAVYRRCLIEGDAQRATFLAKFAKRYVEKTEIIDPEIAKQTELLKKIANKK